MGRRLGEPGDDRRGTLGSRGSRGRRGPRWRGGRLEPREQLWACEAAVPRPALGVQDGQLGVPTGRAVPVARHGGPAPLPDHVPAQPDPARAAQLKPQPARLVHSSRQPASQPVGRQHHEQRPCPPGQPRQPPQPVPHPRSGHRRVPTLGQVQHQQVHRPGGEQRARQRQRLLEVLRHEDHQPLRTDAPRHCLHGIERAGEVEPGHDGPGGLGLRGHPERERRPPRAGAPAERHGGRARQPARPQRGVQRGEARGDHPAVLVRGDARPCGRERVGGRDDGRCRREGFGAGSGRFGLPAVGPGRPGLGLVIERDRRQRERAIDHRRDLSPASRSGRAPSCLEAGEGLGDVGCSGHRTSNHRTPVLFVKSRRAVWRPVESSDGQSTTTSRAGNCHAVQGRLTVSGIGRFGRPSPETSPPGRTPSRPWTI